jgi:hypothetical protein
MWTVSGTGSIPDSPVADSPFVPAGIALTTVVALNATFEPTMRGRLDERRIDAESVNVLAGLPSNAASIGLSGLGHGG